MGGKRSYTWRLVVASLAVGAVGYVVRLPLLPLSTRTKAALGYPREALLNVTERARSHGYLASEHSVVTADGYELRLFRVRRPEATGTPVLLMHGLLQSAASWLDAGPTAGLAYLLADAGADLWLGNVRGTHYSRRHAWLDPDKHPQFWHFCVDEIGRYDLPALVDHVLAQSGADSLNYIGFSQGAGTFFIMCSERPDYCNKGNKVGLAIAIAPATRHLRTKSAVFRSIVEYFEKNEEQLKKNGVWEAFPVGGVLQLFSKSLCQLQEAETMCEYIIEAIDASNPGSIPISNLREALNFFPAGTSVHNMARYGQSIRSKRFQKFDYGPEQNLALYGVREPPAYNLSAVMPPTLVVFGRNDGIVDVRDVQWLLRHLPNVLEAYEVEDPLWTHVDVHWSKNSGKFLMPKIIEYLSRFGGLS